MMSERSNTKPIKQTFRQAQSQQDPKVRVKAKYKHVEEYLEARIADIERLMLDLQCRPFTDDPLAPELVVAVDWSEVLSYAAAHLPHPSDPVLRYLKGESNTLSHLAMSAHEIALIFLFERRLPDKLRRVMLTPHLAEMQHYCQVLLASNVLDAADIDRNIRTAMHASKEFRVLKACITESHNIQDHKLLREELINKLGTTKLLDWMEKDFGPYLRLARAYAAESLPALREMFDPNTKSSGRSKIVGLFDVVPWLETLTQSALQRRYTMVMRQRTISKKIGVSKKIGNIERDADALAILASAGPLLNSTGQQLVFVSRDRNIRGVMEAHTSEFGCLADHYVNQPKRIGPGNGAVPMYRSWRGFLELAIHWDRDTSTVHERLEARLSALIGHWQRLRREPESAKNMSEILAVEWQEDISNIHQMLATENPELSKPKTGDADEFILRTIIQYVTDPKEFDSQRRTMRLKIAEQLESIDLTVGTGIHAMLVEQGQYDALASTFVSRYALPPISTDILRPVDQTKLRAEITVFNAKSSANQSGLAQALTWHSTLSTKGTSEAYHAFITLVILYGRTTAQDFMRLQPRLDRRLKDLPSSSWEWILAVLMHVDALLALDDKVAAERVFHQALIEAEKHAVVGDMRNTMYQALCNAKLLHELDASDAVGERIHLLPERAPSLRVDWNRIHALFKVELLDNNHKGIAYRSICNNLVYGAARLSPIFNEAHGIPEYSKEVELNKAVDLHDPCVLAAVEILRNHHPKTPEQVDTLGYYLTKRAYALTNSKVNPQRLSAAARDLSAAQKHLNRFDDQKWLNKRVVSTKTREANTQHRGLLDEVREVIREWGSNHGS